MPIIEKCAECGLDLHFRPESGQYFHVFTEAKAGWYKRIHLPIPSIQDDLFEGDREEIYRPAQGWSGEFRKVSA